MLRTPTFNPARCTCGSCRTCTDDTSLWMSNLAATGDRWKTANLNQGRGWRAVSVNPAIVGKHLPPNPRRAARPAPDLNVFTADMEALVNQILPGGQRP